MDATLRTIVTFLENAPPYDKLSVDERIRIARTLSVRVYQAGERVYTIGEPLNGVYIVMSGAIETLDYSGTLVSRLTTRETFGERGFLRDGHAASTARVVRESEVLHMPAQPFRRLLGTYPWFERYFSRPQRPYVPGADFSARRVSELMTRNPFHCAPGTTVNEAARTMRRHHVSSLGVTEPGTDCLIGIITVRDLANRVLAENRDGATTLVGDIMTLTPQTLPPAALGTDVLRHMFEHNIGHLPVVEHKRFVGMITQTDLTRYEAISASAMLYAVSRASDVGELASTSRRVPEFLVRLVGASQPHEVVTRQITDITDAITRRLLALAEAELGPPPVPYLWLACGSQGRQEQSGISDQDNCLFLDDTVKPADMLYFEALARRVCDGLNACGYVFCPGDMMATNPRWRQPVHVWRDYFRGWALTHTPQSHMLASVMFDLRPIAGTQELFQDLHIETLENVAKNSIFIAHMIANSLERMPPLGLIRGFATERSGPYRQHIDMKLRGVIPITDLARVYALQGRLTEINTRARLLAAGDACVISASGSRDLVDAYDVIATMRLESQARAIKYGSPPSNYLAPAELSDLERNHLREAFIIVRTMQSAAGHGKQTLR